jgi:hypothetical protein
VEETQAQVETDDGSGDAGFDLGEGIKIVDESVDRSFSAAVHVAGIEDGAAAVEAKPVGWDVSEVAVGESRCHGGVVGPGGEVGGRAGGFELPGIMIVATWPSPVGDPKRTGPGNVPGRLFPADLG